MKRNRNYVKTIDGNIYPKATFLAFISFLDRKASAMTSVKCNWPSCKYYHFWSQGKVKKNMPLTSFLHLFFRTECPALTISMVTIQIRFVPVTVTC